MTQTTTSKKTFLQRLWDVVFAIFYPILIIFSLLFVGVVYLFSAVSWLLSWLLPRPKEDSTPDTLPATWKPWIATDSVSIERILVGEVMFGPSYYQLRSLPPSESLGTHYFGEFYHECFGGVLLQKWNTVVPKELPDFDLLFFRGETAQLHYVDTIKAFAWEVEETSEGVFLRWQENDERDKVLLTEDRVLHDARLLD